MTKTPAAPYVSPREKLQPLIGQTILDITGIDPDTYKVEVVTEFGILSLGGTNEGFLSVSLGQKVAEKVNPSEALAYMEGRKIKTTRNDNPNHHVIVFDDASEVRISSDPDIEHDQKITYTIVRRVDEDIC